VPCAAPVYSLAEQLQLPLRIPQCDLLYVPHYVIPLLYRGPLVVAVNDLIHLERRDFAPSVAAQWYARAMITVAVRRARRVVTLSRYSRDRLCRLTGALAERFEVVYPSIDPRFFQPPSALDLATVREHYGLQAPYFLFVGNAKPHKNLSTLIQAFSLARGRGIDNSLVIVGRFSGIRSNIDALTKLVAEREIGPYVRFLGVIPDEHLTAVYAAAELFVFPSLAEGFGLTPLEAMACGTPVLAARATAVPEVCADAAQYYTTPEDPEELADAIVSLIRDPDRRADLRELGLQRAQRFAHSASTQKMIDLLYEV